ncbi:MAG: uroporphyrinogen-III C-methyltransferase [Nocardioidaceae bacterium]|nr:uroporphyrinogen-III C-methyltransferase [Nocardioidaceae bacterium]
MPAGQEVRDAVYPVGLRLQGRRVVVVGGGQVAQRRVPTLLAAGARVRIVSPWLRPVLEGLASTGEVEWSARGYRSGDLADAWYALAATDDAATNAAVAREAEAARLFCVRADDATQSSAWTPASGRHGGVSVAVHAQRDPRRAAHVRDQVVEQLRTGDLAAPRHRARQGGVVLVGGGPGDPELITLAGRRALAEADVVVVDRLAPTALLDELPSQVEIVDATKLPRGRSAPQEAINRVLVDGALAGKLVVRLKGGDPYVFGRGFEELIACAEAGVPCRVVPGVTSAISVPALAGVPVTHRGVAHELVIVSGHLPPGHESSLVDWAALGRLRGTIVVMMGVDTLPAIAAELIAGGRAADTPVAVVQSGSTAGERRVLATLSTVADVVAAEQVSAPATVVIGDVVGVAATVAATVAGSPVSATLAR